MGTSAELRALATMATGRCRSKLEQSIVFHVPPFNASDVFYPSYATSSSSDSDQDGGPDRCALPPL